MIDGEVLIRIRHLRKEYGTSVPIKDVNADIRRGEVISIIGPSGTGKSTLLRMINQLEKATSGEIWLEDTEVTAPGADLPAIRKRMGMVFQSFFLFSHMNVIENVMHAPVKLAGLSKKEAYNRALTLLDKVGLKDRADRWPEELSGGQKQRVTIARTLAMEPDIILFDEPTSALDPISVSEVQSVIKMLAEAGNTMMIVTHDMNFAREVSTRIFYMDEGIIYEDGTPEQIFENQKKEKTRRFVTQTSIMRYEAEDDSFDYYNLFARVEEYGRQQHLPLKDIHKVQLLLEELGIATIIPGLEKPYGVEILIEHSRKNGEITLIIRWNGKEVDPKTYMDEVSQKILQAYASEITYHYGKEHSLPNEVRIKIKK